MPLLSICIPTYNFGHFIGETLDSILPQMAPDMEIVIVDGGSTDSTPEVVQRFLDRGHAIHYHRLEKRGGIDRDMALSVSLAKGEYVWLFSSDDVMVPGAIERVRQEIALKLDVYISGLTICGLDVRKKYWDHPIFKVQEPTTFDLAKPEERALFFQNGMTTTAFFSFMSSLIIQKKRWDETSVEEEFYSSCWAHVARIFGMLPQGLKVRYLKEALLLKRGFNDSFLDRGIVHRISITVDGYHRIAEKLFGATSMEAFHIRRAVCFELPLKIILITAKSQIRNQEEQKRLDQIVRKLYQDPSLLNTLRKWAYFNTPSQIARLLAVIYKYRRFFKYFRFERIKYFLSKQSIQK